MEHEFDLQRRAAQRYLGIRRPTPDGVPAMVDTAFPELFARLGERGIAPAGPIIIRTWAIDAELQPTEVEAAVPVGEETEGDDLLDVGALPEGRYAVAIHDGPYNHDELPDLVGARRRLLDRIGEEGLKVSTPSGDGQEFACAAEHFLVGPDSEPDFTKWRTEVTFLVID